MTDVPRSIKDQEVPNYETVRQDVPPLNFNNPPQNFNEPPASQQQQQRQPTANNEDTYLPEEPVLLTDYEEERLSEQIRTQLGNSTSVEKLKLYFQELTTYDPKVTSYVHYSDIQLVASQLGVIFSFIGKQKNIIVFV